MTPSKVWALVVALLLIAAATGGAFYWRKQHPDAPLLVKLETPAPPSAPAKPAELSPLTAAPPATPAPKAPPAQEVKAPPAQTTPPAQSAKAEPPGPVAPPPAAAPPPAGPSFDVVRVEPKGDTVVAGKGAPNAKVQLVAGGKVVAETKADPNGQFVILPPRLGPGDYDLTLREVPEGKAPEESKQSVAVSVPQPGAGPVVVALAEPGKATKLLSAPPGAAPGAGAGAPAPGKVVIRSAELENGTGFYATGVAAPGATIHVYLNDAHIADVTAGPDGAWSVRVLKGLTGGHYVVRADAIAADGKVASRAEVPFDVPMTMAAAGKPPAALKVTPKVAPAIPNTAAPATPAAPATSAPATSEPTTPPASEQATAATPPVTPGAPPSGSETSSAETSVPATPKPKLAEAAPPVVPPAPTSTPQNVVVEQVATARVVAGDNLWNISRSRLGDGLRYTQIYAANVDQIRDPNLIYPGQVFVVPGR